MDHEIYLQMREVEDRHWWFAARRRILQRVISSLSLPDQARVLDVGCGTGGNLKLLSQFGQVSAMEMDDTARNLAQARNIADVRAGKLPDGIPFPGQHFDLIVLLDVLEHINDDAGSLIALKSILAPNGHVVLTVPAFPFLWSQHDEVHHHKRRYRTAGLRRVIQGAGLEVVYMTHYNMWLFPAIAMARLAQRFLPSRENKPELKAPASLPNMLLETLFGSERFLVPRARLPLGVSLLAVLEVSVN